MKTDRYIVIMAGGVGSRFWPSSRENLPKQFLDILGIGESLLRMTFNRALKVVSLDNILIATNAKYKELVIEHIPEISEHNILLEPSRNNTAPCIAYSLLKIYGRFEKSCFAVLPSDHVIVKEEEFINKLIQAFDFASNNEAIVTLGIEPSRPDTGYGYIKCSVGDNPNDELLKVLRFTEKPDLSVAQRFIKEGNYLWNAGIFIWSSDTLLKAFRLNAPEILNVLSSDLSKLDTEEEFDYINEVYPRTTNISVDYAILEPSKNVYTLRADIGWSDLGTWNSLYEYSEKMDNGNVIISGVEKLEDVENTIIRAAPSKLVVVKGLRDFIIVDEHDALLIYPRSEEQAIKTVRKGIEDKSYL